MIALISSCSIFTPLVCFSSLITSVLNIPKMLNKGGNIGYPYLSLVLVGVLLCQY